jgi:hypothetical protein
MRAWKYFFEDGKFWVEEISLGRLYHDVEYGDFVCMKCQRSVYPDVVVVKLTQVRRVRDSSSIRNTGKQLYRKYFTCPLCKQSVGILDYGPDSYPLKLEDVTGTEADKNDGAD